MMEQLLQSHSRNKKRRRRRKENGNSTYTKQPIECVRLHINNISAGKIILPSLKKEENGGQEENVICLLFLIINTLPYENIWRKWIDTKDDSSSSKTIVKVFIHAKIPDQVKSPWVKGHLIDKSFCPGWGTVELTKAMVELARVALLKTKEFDTDGTKNVKFLYASESCIPICTLSYASMRLFENSNKNKSWLKVKFKPRNGYNGSSQWVPIENAGIVPPECVCKADQWVALTRKHAKMILNLYDYIHGLKSNINFWPCFQKGCASDEMYFPTLLSCCGLIPNRNNYKKYIISDHDVVKNNASNSSLSNGSNNNNNNSNSNVNDETQTLLLYNEINMKQRLTYVVWNYADFGNYDSNKQLCDRPEIFHELNKDLINSALKEGCIFVRKLKDSNLTAETWFKLIRTQEALKK
jgi:hypothetical protein